MTQTLTSTTVNGFDTGALGGLAEALKVNGDAGRVTFLSSSRWQDGARVFTRFGGYRIDGKLQHEGTRAFVVLGDEPSEFGVSDAAPAPVEMLLHALANCITATSNAYASLMGVHLDRLEVQLEGELDLHGMFALDDAVRPGLTRIRAIVTVAGDADEATLRDVVQRGFRYSPIRDTIERGVGVDPEVVVA